ncbi:MAG: 5-(carboxyamino)imidazole ribonucleotide synthase [Hyphomicrobium sp.]
MISSSFEVLPPGSIIGILGSGQLGRMLALAAARMGLKCHIFSDVTGPAFDVASSHIQARYDDEKALAEFAKPLAVATYEFENIPLETVEFLNRFVPVRPGQKALACAQDRIKEKNLARSLGSLTAPYAQIDSLNDLENVVKKEIPIPCILKTRRFGYDGKGQSKILKVDDIESAWQSMKNLPSILEGFVKFQREISVVAARALDGSFCAYDVTENEHVDHILRRSIAPARISSKTAKKAIQIAQSVANELEYVGVYAIEYFALHHEGSETILFNEMAPRVHNSGHWTQDGALTSQFEQHIRAIVGWPLGPTTLKAAGVEMVNLIGEQILSWKTIITEPDAILHHYGKTEIRDGRKMGHVNRLLSKRPL